MLTVAVAPTHAIVVNVTFKPGMEEAARQVLETEVVPGAKSAAGFVAGYWMHSKDGSQGSSVELFDTLSNAEAELARRSTEMPPEAPVTIENVAILEIAASA
jgi:hypothetical protein